MQRDTAGSFSDSNVSNAITIYVRSICDQARCDSVFNLAPRAVKFNLNCGHVRDQIISDDRCRNHAHENNN